MGTSITIASVRDIPLNKLVPSTRNVRLTSGENDIAELAASIFAHGLLQSLTVRSQRDDANRETGRYEVVAGGRRLAALRLLVQQKKITKSSLVSCVVREDGSARELSLVENVQRVNLHPADQFEAFRRLNEDEGLGAEDIAARFGVTPRVVRERLKLARVSPALIEQYRSGALSLDQIMAFAVVDDTARQEEVWANLSYDKSPSFIRRCLLQSYIAPHHKLAVFVGIEAYMAVGGAVLRDLFSEDNGGYLTDIGLVERLATEKLEKAGQGIREEGWKWVDVALDFPHTHGLSRVYPREVDLPEADANRLEEIEAELDRLAAEHEEAEEPDAELETRGAALNSEYEAIDARGRVFEPSDIARGGAIVSVDRDGALAIVRGLVRSEDEPNVERESGTPSLSSDDTGERKDRRETFGLSDRLIVDLNAQRTLALRDQLAVFPDMAHTAITHALASQLFYRGIPAASCLNVVASSVTLEGRVSGIGESIAARNVSARHESWAARLPREASGLWAFVTALSFNERQALLAHCVALLVDAVDRNDRKTAADTLAQAIDLDMRAYWRPSADNYFSRVPKAMILDAVREGISSEASERLRPLKKSDMAQDAEKLLSETPWLPPVLRLRSDATSSSEEVAAAEYE